mgnify:FL=1
MGRREGKKNNRTVYRETFILIKKFTVIFIFHKLNMKKKFPFLLGRLWGEGEEEGEGRYRRKKKIGQVFTSHMVHAFCVFSTDHKLIKFIYFYFFSLKLSYRENPNVTLL